MTSAERWKTRASVDKGERSTFDQLLSALHQRQSVRMLLAGLPGWALEFRTGTDRFYPGPACFEGCAGQQKAANDA
jgi:hypothetical protein